MTKKNEARLNMYYAVISYCNSNPAILATVPAFQTAFTAFQSTVNEIHSVAQLEANVISGITADKSQLKNNLSAEAAHLAAKVFAFASNTNNNSLKQQVNFTPSDLKWMKDETLLVTCGNIRFAANVNVGSLADYGVTAVSIAAFQSLIDAYTAQVSSPRNAVSQRSSYSQTLTGLFKQADAALKSQLDKIALGFKTSNEDFFNTYMNNRMIILPSTSTTQIAGNITSAANNQPVEGALVQLVDDSVSGTTDEEGNFILKPIAIGKQSIKITKTGFADKIISSIVVKLGKTSTVDAVITAMTA